MRMESALTNPSINNPYEFVPDLTTEHLLLWKLYLNNNNPKDMVRLTSMKEAQITQLCANAGITRDIKYRIFNLLGSGTLPETLMNAFDISKTKMDSLIAEMKSGVNAEEQGRYIAKRGLTISVIKEKISQLKPSDELMIIGETKEIDESTVDNILSERNALREENKKLKLENDELKGAITAADNTIRGVLSVLNNLVNKK